MAAGRLPPTPESVAHPAAAITEQDDSLLRGKSFKTQFYGATYPISALRSLPGVDDFMKEFSVHYPVIRDTKNSIHGNRKRVEARDETLLTTKYINLESLLLSKQETDMLVAQYLDSVNRIYPIIHMPSFWRDYADMWNEGPTHHVGVLVLVLLMVYSVRCVTSEADDVSTMNSSPDNIHATSAIAFCERWLATQSQKHVTIINFQIRFVLQLAKQVNAGKNKRSYTEAGTMLRFYMAAGLHRDPDSIKKPTSSLDKEMRRRLWAAATALELQACFDRGMVSDSWPLQSDCPCPSHEWDNEFTAPTPELQVLDPERSRQPTTPLGPIPSTMHLCHALNSALNSLHSTIDPTSLAHHTDILTAHLSTLHPTAPNAHTLVHAHHYITLSQYLLALHTRNHARTSSATSRALSAHLITTTSHNLLALHTHHHASHPILTHLHSTPLRAALALLTTSPTSPSPIAASLLVHPADPLHDFPSVSLAQARDLLASKIKRTGRSHRDFWLLLAAAARAKCIRDPARKGEWMREAVEACKAVCPSAEDGQTYGALGQKGMGGVVGDGRVGLEGLEGEGLFDFGEMGDWMFGMWGAEEVGVGGVDWTGFGDRGPAGGI